MAKKAPSNGIFSFTTGGKISGLGTPGSKEYKNPPKITTPTPKKTFDPKKSSSSFIVVN